MALSSRLISGAIVQIRRQYERLGIRQISAQQSNLNVGSLRNNIIANLAGGGWNAALVVLITPLQIGLLGAEAYGVISLIAVLQIISGALDFGLATTVTREIARDNGCVATTTRALVNAATAAYWLIALIGGGVLWLIAIALPHHWLTAQNLPAEVIASAIELIAGFLLLRWPVAIYAGILSGAQAQVTLNTLKSTAITLRLAGGAILLLVKPDLICLLWWYVACAVTELASFIYHARRAYGGLALLPRFEFSAIRPVAKFSSTMYLISLLAIFLTQIDRLAITRLLGLKELGYYSIAYTAAMGMTLIQTAINNAALPSLAGIHGASDDTALRDHHRHLSELMGFVMVPAALTLIFFAQPILGLWVGSAIANEVAGATAILAAGFLLNAVYSSTYLCGIAAGQPGLFLRANVFGLLGYLPALGLGIGIGGINGAATAWLLLNLYYIAVVLPRAHTTLALVPAGRWLRVTFAPFAGSGCAAFAVGWLLSHEIGQWQGALAGFASAMVFYFAAGLRLSSPTLRSEFAKTIAAAWRRLNAR